MVDKELNFNTAINTLQSMLLDYKLGNVGKRNVAHNVVSFGEYLLKQLKPLP